MFELLSLIRKISKKAILSDQEGMEQNSLTGDDGIGDRAIKATVIVAEFF